MPHGVLAASPGDADERLLIGVVQLKPDEVAALQQRRYAVGTGTQEYAPDLWPLTLHARRDEPGEVADQFDALDGRVDVLRTLVDAARVGRVALRGVTLEVLEPLVALAPGRLRRVPKKLDAIQIPMFRTG